MKIKPNSTLLMTGDSITDCGRSRTPGDTSGNFLGYGYVSFIDGMLAATCPEYRIRIVNMGVGGDTIRELDKRWQTDVLDTKPDWLSIMIGINDVWRHFDGKIEPETWISIDEYSTTLKKLIDTSKPMLEGLILATPYFIEPDRSDAMRALMDRFGSTVRGLAKEYGAVFVDTQKAFDDALRVIDPNSLSGDRVHPNMAGYIIIARAFLKALGYTWK